jgi:hypothetical protein
MNSIKNKGGRPRKAVKRSEKLTVMCTSIEKKTIEFRSKSVHLSKSEFLRDFGLNGKINIKALPGQVLLLIGRINQIASNLNQIAHKRNAFDQLNAIERAELKNLAEEIKQVTTEIRIYLK